VFLCSFLNIGLVVVYVLYARDQSNRVNGVQKEKQHTKYLLYSVRVLPDIFCVYMISVAIIIPRYH